MGKRFGMLAGLLVGVAAAPAFGGPPSVGGVISGTVSYEGTPAKMGAIDLSSEPDCAKMYRNPPVAETVVTGPDHHLANVVVFVSAGAPDEPAPSKPAVLTQKGCRYLPHVLVLQANQELEIQNEDQTSHNVHPMSKLNREWNKSQPPGAPAISETYEKPEIIPVKCNVHPWMRGTIVVVKNSHYAVTGESGTFALPNLPPGNYTITAWHEAYGEQSQEVTVRAGEAKTVHLLFTAKP